MLPEHLCTERIQSTAIASFSVEELVFRRLEFIFQNIRPDNDHFSSVVFILGAVLSLKQAKRLPCFPHLIQEDIRQAGVGFNREMPANIIVGDGEPLCPLFVRGRDPAIFRFLLYSVGEDPVHAVKPIVLDDGFRTVIETVVVVVFTDSTLNRPGAVAAFLKTFAPKRAFLVANGLAERKTVNRLMLWHGQNRPAV